MREREGGNKERKWCRWGLGQGAHGWVRILCVITLKREEMVLVGDTSRHSHTLFCGSQPFYFVHLNYLIRHTLLCFHFTCNPVLSWAVTLSFCSHFSLTAPFPLSLNLTPLHASFGVAISSSFFFWKLVPGHDNASSSKWSLASVEFIS